MNDFWSQLDPGFLAPIWLLVGLGAIVAILFLEAGDRRRRNRDLRRFAASHLVVALTTSVSPWKRFLKRLLLVTAIALLFVAMARPHLLVDWREEDRTGLDILIAVDCSKSMLSQDVKPSRLGRAQLAISDFADRLPDNRLGLIAFAGDAFLQCPLTLDHDAFQSAVRELDTDTIPRPGTDIATAIDQAVLALKSQSSNSKILILVTDGEDLEGRVLDAAKAAAATGLKIYTVGVGTAEGGMIPEIDDSGVAGFHRDANGDIVQSKLDENTLRQIASLTGGAYVPLGQQGEGLEEIYNRYIGSMPKHQFEERREMVRIERFEWPLGLAILLLMVEFMMRERALVRPTAPPVVRPGGVRRRARNTATAALFAGGWLIIGTAQGAPADKAERDYKSGQYEQATENYRHATEADPGRDDLKYDLGDAAYKAGEFTQAEEAFRKALNTPDLDLQGSTYYNLGNAQFRHGEAMQKVDPKKTMGLWEQALHSYDSSLKLKTSADARYNYELVKKKLEQMKQQQQQQGKGNSSDKDQKPNQDGKQQGQNQPGQGGQGNPQDGQNQGQSGQQNGKPGDDKSQDGDKPDKSGQKDSPDGKNENGPVRTYSGTRSQDLQDPGAKSRQEAEDLLDSLKDDERHVTARTLNDNNGAPPPPPSGKDW